MKFKSIILTAALLVALPFSAKAQDVENYEEYQVGCEQGVECNDFDVMYEQQGETSEEISQRTRPRRTRRSSDLRRIYVGGTLGIFLPSELEELEVLDDGEIESIDPGTGFGASLYGGYKFNDLLSADGEFLIFGGGADPIDDSGYVVAAFMLNPRVTVALNKNNPKSIYGFVSPGLGVGIVGLNDEIDDQFSGDDTTAAGFALQVKAGVGYPITERLDVIGQARYFNTFNVFEVQGFDGDTEDQGFESVGLELGVNFKL